MKIRLLIAALLFLSGNAFAQQIMFNAAANNTTVSTCNGFIIDSGGQGGSGYSNNQNITITICPGTPGEIISVQFNLFNLSTADDNPSPTQTNVDYMSVYDGTSTAAPTLGTYSGTELQGVVIQATALNPTGCITLRFTSNTLGTGAFTAAVQCETPCADPTAAGNIVGGITSDSIRVCVGDPVSFVNNGSSAQTGFTLADFKWDFMDGTTANGQNVTHAFEEPGQYRVQLFVTDDNGCGNANLIDLQVLVATIPDFVNFPHDTTLCLGESVTFTAQPELYEVLWDGFPGSETIDDGCLSDTLLGVSQDVELLQTGFAAGLMIDELSDIESFCLDLEHSFMGDIVVIITCPNGQSEILHQQGGGGTQLGVPVQDDNVDCSDPATLGEPFTYCFTPTATQTWVEWVDDNGWGGGTLPAGDYEPIQPLTNLIGCPVNGVWTLSVIDNWAADDGTLFAFSLNLDPSLYPEIQTFEPQIGAGADSSYWTFPAPHATNLSANGDVITITPTAAGSYTYTYSVLDNFGCINDTTVTVTVTANPTPNAGPDITLCAGQSAQLNGMIAGSSGGSPCPFTLNLHDSYGDSWNGNNLLVTINGVTTSYTVPVDESSFTVSVPHGTGVTVQFDGAGNWAAECSYEVISPNGVIVVQGGGDFEAPSTTPETFTADCFGGFDFVWSPAAFVSNPNIPNPVGTFPAATTMTLTVMPTGHPLCATSDQMSVFMLSANPGRDSVLFICPTGTPEDLFPLLGPNVSLMGEWTNPAGAVITMPYDPVTMDPGAYTYTTDSNGCVASAVITVSEVPVTVDVAVTNVSCHGDDDGSVLATIVSTHTYTLNGGPTQTFTTSPVTIGGLTAGTYTLVAGSGSCMDQETFTITEPLPLSITSISADTSICPGSPATLMATGAGGSSATTFTWSEGPIGSTVVGTGVPLTVTPATAPAQYCVVLSEACGSTPATACMMVTNPPAIIPVITPDPAVGCYPLPVNFTNNSTNGTVVSAIIDFGDGQTEALTGTAGTFHLYADPGSYTVNLSVTSDIGCVYTQTFPALITVMDNPEADFTILPNPVSMFSPEVQLIDASSLDAVSFSWNVPEGIPVTATTENMYTQFPEGVPGVYDVHLYVENAAGCWDTITKKVIVVSEVLLYAPNAFTPDGDEFNQLWNVTIDGIDRTSFNLKIYNRWGEVIWESNDPDAGWDGTYHGNIVQAGMYTWTIQVKDINTDEKLTFDGFMQVLR